MVIVLLADGFEEIEALTPVDMLRRANIEVRTVGIGAKVATGSHGIQVVCDMTADEVDPKSVDMAVFPGGMPGALNLDSSPFTDKIIAAVKENGGRLAAICASPLIFGRRGLLCGKRATCYPGFEGELKGATVIDAQVVTDGYITTGRAMGASIDFSKELIALLANRADADRIGSAIIES